MQKGKLIIIVGPSGSGKTLIANEIILAGQMFEDRMGTHMYPADERYIPYLKEHASDSSKSTFYATKYLTRKPRPDDIGVVHSTIDEMRSKCDIIMPGYNDGDFIGFNTDEIMNQIDQGKTPIIVSGFMEALQLILKKFADKGRLDDVFIVGIDGFLKSEESYTNLEHQRYKSDEEREVTLESAKKRFMHSRLFARQYVTFHNMLDWVIQNYRMKYIKEPDVLGDATVIQDVVSKGYYERTEEQKEKLVEFINADLSQIEPVKESEIKLI